MVMEHSKDIFLWSANIKNYTNWSFSNPLRYKSKNSWSNNLHRFC